MRQDVIDLYDEFTHRGLDRRVFMRRLAELTGGSAAAYAALAALRADPAKAAIVAPDDPRLRAERITFSGAEGRPTKGYLVVPADAPSLRGGVVVVHENRGLNPHIEDIARRVALGGFNALAVDFLSPLGGTPIDEDRARELIGQLDAAGVVADAAGASAFLRAREDSNGKVGIVGFCWGGGVVGRVATAQPDLDAGVVFYGIQPPAEQVAAIQAPLLLHYAGQDERINAGIPAFAEALKSAGKTYVLHMYEGAQHAFNNDTSAARYDPDAAALAWQRTMAFFAAQLG
jgi:carboxymethylenebutenolidase